MKTLAIHPIKGKEGRCQLALLHGKRGYSVEETHFGSTAGTIISSQSSEDYSSIDEAKAALNRREEYLTNTSYAQLNESDY